MVAARCRAPGQTWCPPGLGVHPWRHPGSLGSCAYILLHRRHVDCSVRAGEPDVDRQGHRTALGACHRSLDILKCPGLVDGTLASASSGEVTTPEQGPSWKASPVACCPCTSLPLGPARASLTFLQPLQGIDVVEAKVQLRIYIRGDPRKPKGGVSEQQILLPFRGAEELE